MMRILLLAMLVSAPGILKAQDPFSKPFNSGWQFRLVDGEGLAKPLATGQWKTASIPHDWNMDLPVDEKHASAKNGGYYPGGKGEYKKKFRIPSTEKSRQHVIQFDGVYMNAEVILNGHSLGMRPYGYVPVKYKLDKWLKYDAENELVVKVDNMLQPSSRWYNGAGIYRDVWMITLPQTFIERDSVIIQTHIDPNSNKSWLDCYAVLSNNSNQAQTLTYTVGARDIRTANKSIAIPAGRNIKIHERINLSMDASQWWSPENPRLHPVTIQINANNKLLDQLNYKIGFRDFKFRADSGFFLNFKPYKIKGVNEHHDLGALGAAFHKSAMKRRMLMLKEMGCNALRTAHNPAAPGFMDLTDELGFLVMDEVFDEWVDGWDKQGTGKSKYGYHTLFYDWVDRDLADAIVRDRNHTSVFLWSVGNETPDLSYAHGRARLDSMVKRVKLWDTTRLVTLGTNQMSKANETNFSPGEEVVGYNGGGGGVFMYEADHAKYPDRKFIATEVPHTFQTRGVYRTHTFYRDKNPQGGKMAIPNYTLKEFFPEEPRFYSSSYDNSTVRVTAYGSWKLTKKFPFFSGEFRWTGFDYLGESNEGWPARYYNFGVIDLCGFPKDMYYFYQQEWTTKPMLHLFPHWTHTGKEGDSLRLVAHSNLDQVELFMNGVSLGKRSKDTASLSFYWTVAYQPGEIKAVAYKDGKTMLTEMHRTAGPATQLVMRPENYRRYIDAERIIYVPVDVVDAKGNFVPLASNLITFKVSPNAKILAVDNGDSIDNTLYSSTSRKAFRGKIIAIVQVSDDKPFEVEASSPGLGSARMMYR